MKYSLLTLVLGVIFLGGCSKTFHKQPSNLFIDMGQPTWESFHPALVEFKSPTTLPQAVQRAREEGKYLLLDFRGQHCYSCKIMEAEVYSNRALADMINEKFISVIIYTGNTQGNYLASYFGIQSYPTLIFADVTDESHVKREAGTSLSEVRYATYEALYELAMK